MWNPSAPEMSDNPKVKAALKRLQEGETTLNLSGAFILHPPPLCQPHGSWHPHACASGMLRSLHAGNEIGDEGVKELGAALRVNTTLTTLNLSGALIPHPPPLRQPHGRWDPACMRVGHAPHAHTPLRCTQAMR